MKALVRGAAVGLAVAASSATAYTLAVRPKLLAWGATAAETAEALPGDDLVPQPGSQATLAVSIEAPIELVWPWLAQIGYRRGGWYADNAMQRRMGLAGSVEDPERSAEAIHPELQNLKVGDVIPAAAGGGLPIAILRPPHALVMHAWIDANTGKPVNAAETTGPMLGISWGWYLREVAHRTTRLIVRWRIYFPSNPMAALGTIAMVEPGGVYMLRASMLGIKRRAEGRPPEENDCGH